MLWKLCHYMTNSREAWRIPCFAFICEYIGWEETLLSYSYFQKLKDYWYLLEKVFVEGINVMEPVDGQKASDRHSYKF